jgi:uncharacterized protein
MIQRRTLPWIVLTVLAFLGQAALAQSSAYSDSLSRFRNDYITTHEVVKDQDRKFLRFFPIDSAYRVICRFEQVSHGNWFQMNTSGLVRKTYRSFGKLSFIIQGKTLHLYIYQSQSLLNSKDYKDYLFIPFTDETTGKESYGGGRYLEARLNEIKNNTLELDFNKSYNPYCAYTSGYNCPIPPAENNLPVSILAGEMNYGKPGHP